MKSTVLIMVFLAWSADMMGMQNISNLVGAKSFVADKRESMGTGLRKPKKSNHGTPDIEETYECMQAFFKRVSDNSREKEKSIHIVLAIEY